MAMSPVVVIDMVAIETTDLRKRYGDDVLALDGIDLRVEEGEILSDAAREAATMIDRIAGAADLALPADFWGQ